MNIKAILLSTAFMMFGTGVALADDAAFTPNWSGFYIGGNLGGVWGSTNVNIPLYPAQFDISTTSVTGGVQFGRNWMASDKWLIGLEGDVSALDLSASHLSGGGPTGEEYAVNFNFTYSARARVGYVDGSYLWYVTGGWSGANLDNAQYIPVAGGVKSTTLNGWIVGGGLEYTWRPNWVVGLEYLHSDYGSVDFVYNGPTSIDLQTETVRLRLSYLFN